MSKERDFRESMVPLMNSNKVVILDSKSKIYGCRNESGDLVVTPWEELTPAQQEYVVKNTPHVQNEEIKTKKKSITPSQEELDAFWECR